MTVAGTGGPLFRTQPGAPKMPGNENLKYGITEVDAIVKEFPNAFDEVTNGEGNVVLLTTKLPLRDTQAYLLVLPNQEGFVEFGPGPQFNETDFQRNKWDNKMFHPANIDHDGLMRLAQTAKRRYNELCIDKRDDPERKYGGYVWDDFDIYDENGILVRTFKLGIGIIDLEATPALLPAYKKLCKDIQDGVIKS